MARAISVRMRRLLLATAAVGIGAAAPAEATVLFEFQPIYNASTGDVRVTGWLAISDQAFASGFHLQANSFSPQVNWSSYGIEGLYFSYDMGGAIRIRSNFSTLTRVPDGPNYLGNDWRLAIDLDPSSTPKVYLDHYWGFTDAYYWRLGATSTFRFSSDGMTGCTQQPYHCDIDGSWVWTNSIPEPSSAALFGVALVGAGVMVRRRRQPL